MVADVGHTRAIARECAEALDYGHGLQFARARRSPPADRCVKRDRCFHFDASRGLQRQLKSAYATLWGGDRIEQQVADTERRYMGEGVPESFDDYMRQGREG